MAVQFDPAPQQLVMTLLGAYVRPRTSRTVWAGGVVALLDDLGITNGSARIALSRLARRDLLRRQKRGRRVHYALTDKARDLLDEGDRRIFALGRDRPAAGEWTLLMHTIPDERRQARDALVRRLRFLGFGSVQDATWIAPRDAERDVRSLLDDLGVRSYAGLMRATPGTAADTRTFIERAWDLEAADKAYAEFVADFADVTAGSDRDAFGLRTRLVHAFRRFPTLDPDLPPELAEPPRHRAEAVRLFHDRYPALAPQAQRYFDEVTGP